MVNNTNVVYVLNELIQGCAEDDLNDMANKLEIGEENIRQEMTRVQNQEHRCVHEHPERTRAYTLSLHQSEELLEVNS